MKEQVTDIRKDKDKKQSDNPKLSTNDAKTLHIVEAAQLAIESRNLRARLIEIDSRIAELSYILMAIEQVEASEKGSGI